MVIFFIFLIILFLITSLFLLLLLSNIEVEINKLCFNTNNAKYEKLEDYLFYIRLKLFDKITWIKIKIDSEKIDKIKRSKVLKSKIFEKLNKSYNIKSILLKNRKKILKKDNIKYIKELDIEVKRLILYMDICTSSSIFTSFAVVAIATIISIVLAKSIKKYSKNKYKYIITPIYEYKPRLKIELNCIIDIKIVHIMNVIYMLIKKRSVVYDERTSNRGAYVCSNEQYSRYG